MNLRQTFPKLCIHTMKTFSQKLSLGQNLPSEVDIQCQLYFLLLLQSCDDGAETGGHYVAMSRIKKHGRVIDHSSTANGMHGIKLMVACSSRLLLFIKWVEFCGNGCILYLRWGNLRKKRHFHCCWDTTQNKPERNISTAVKFMSKEDSSLQVCDIGPT